jgi:hypothetical protein
VDNLHAADLSAWVDLEVPGPLHGGSHIVVSFQDADAEPLVIILVRGVRVHEAEPPKVAPLGYSEERRWILHGLLETRTIFSIPQIDGTN